MELSRGTCVFCVKKTKVIQSSDLINFVEMIPKVFEDSSLNLAEKIKSTINICPICCFKLTITEKTKNKLIKCGKSNKAIKDNEQICNLCCDKKELVKFETDWKYFTEKIEDFPVFLSKKAIIICTECFFYLDTLFYFRAGFFNKYPQTKIHKAVGRNTTPNKRLNSHVLNESHEKIQKNHINVFHRLSTLAEGKLYVKDEFKKDALLYKSIPFVNLFTKIKHSYKQNNQRIKIKLRPKSERCKGVLRINLEAKNGINKQSGKSDKKNKKDTIKKEPSGKRRLSKSNNATENYLKRNKTRSSTTELKDTESVSKSVNNNSKDNDSVIETTEEDSKDKTKNSSVSSALDIDNTVGKDSEEGDNEETLNTNSESPQKILDDVIVTESTSQIDETSSEVISNKSSNTIKPKESVAHDGENSDDDDDESDRVIDDGSEKANCEQNGDESNVETTSEEISKTNNTMGKRRKSVFHEAENSDDENRHTHEDVKVENEKANSEKDVDESQDKCEVNELSDDETDCEENEQLLLISSDDDTKNNENQSVDNDECEKNTGMEKDDIIEESTTNDNKADKTTSVILDEDLKPSKTVPEDIIDSNSNDFQEMVNNELQSDTIIERLNEALEKELDFNALVGNNLSDSGSNADDSSSDGSNKRKRSSSVERSDKKKKKVTFLDDE